jgi:tetratricopeptide (TPR) repeat protein
MTENSSSKILIGVLTISAFVITSYVFFIWFKEFGVSANVYSAIGLVAGALCAFIVMSSSGIIKEFTIKGASVELTAKLEKEIGKVQNDVQESKRETTKQISDLSSIMNQNFQSFNSRIDNAVNNINSNLANAQSTASSNPVIYNAIGDLALGLSKQNNKITSFMLKQEGVDINDPQSVHENTSPEVKNEIGDVIETQKKSEAILKSLPISPKFDIDYALFKANLLYAEGNYDEAIHHYNKVLQHDHNHTDALFYKGWTLIRMGRFQEALEAFETILKNDPDSIKGLHGKGVALYRLGKIIESNAAYDRVLSVDPNMHRSLYNKACNEARMGNADAAIDFLTRAINVKPRLKKKAKNDDAFDGIKDNPKFVNLIA